jgi:hypothetical protein
VFSPLLKIESSRSYLDSSTTDITVFVLLNTDYLDILKLFLPEGQMGFLRRFNLIAKA